MKRRVLVSISLISLIILTFLTLMVNKGIFREKRINYFELNPGWVTQQDIHSYVELSQTNDVDFANSKLPQFSAYKFEDIKEFKVNSNFNALTTVQKNAKSYSEKLSATHLGEIGSKFDVTLSNNKIESIHTGINYFSAQLEDRGSFNEVFDDSNKTILGLVNLDGNIYTLGNNGQYLMALDAKDTYRNTENDISGLNSFVLNDKLNLEPSCNNALLNTEVEITVLLGFTSKAASHAKQKLKMAPESLFHLAELTFNSSLRESSISNIRIKAEMISGIEYVSKTKGMDVFNRDLTKLTNASNNLSSDEGLRNFIEKRKTAQADIAVLVVWGDDETKCGIANSNANAKNALAVVNIQCLGFRYSYIHEVGHILGARHENDDNNEPKFARGFISSDSIGSSSNLSSIMASQKACKFGDCARIPRWSSPNTLVQGKKFGSEEHNNACLWRMRAKEVSQFGESL